MKTKIYRLSYQLDKEGYKKSVHELECKETEKQYKDITGKSGYRSIVRKDELNKVVSSHYNDTLRFFKREAFCLEEDIPKMKKELQENIEKTFLSYYGGIVLMKSHLEQI